MFLELKLSKMRTKKEKELNEKNHAIFKEIEKYINNSTLNSFEKEGFFQQLLDTMLESQLENKSIDLFIGEDYTDFCDLAINKYTESKSFAPKLISFIEGLIFYIGIWIILDMIFSLKLQFELSSLIAASLVYISLFSALYIQKPENTKTISLKSNTKFALKSIMLFVPMFIISKIIINIITNILNLNIHKTISLYSVIYFIPIYILFLLFSEFYKVKSNKSKIIV